MCGIFGIVGTEPIELKNLEKACAMLAHRGPDNQGIWVSPNRCVALGHRRLSILDLSSTGNQPLCNGEKTLWISYNGEIYNFRELRKELIDLGYQFRSQSDTEVILCAYQAWGQSCVDRFNGMFAFAIWDSLRQRLMLARDRFGIKPLYYYHRENQFVFASELKAIETFPELTLQIDESALFDFFTYMYVPTPKTPFVDVHKLPPGHILSLENHKTNISAYWDLQIPASGYRAEPILEGLRERLNEAVRSHMVSDVPVGSLLSGGLDSSSVTALANRHTTYPMFTFSIGFDEDQHSETHHARRMATHLGTVHHEQIVSWQDAKNVSANLLQIYDEPFADSSAVPTLKVCQLASQYVKVALSGDGGDEVFGGYNWYTRHLKRRIFNVVPNQFRQWLPEILESGPWARLRGMPTAIDGLRPDIERHVAVMGGFTQAHKKKILRPEFLKKFRGYEEYWYFQKHWHKDLDLLTRLQYLDLKTYLPDDILTKVDRASMSFSLEIRPPLLDHNLVEYVMGIPVTIRNPHGQLKALFKTAMQDFLPSSILEREKKGFSIPLKEWLPHLNLSSAQRLSPNQAWVKKIFGDWTLIKNHSSEALDTSHT